MEPDAPGFFDDLLNPENVREARLAAEDARRRAAALPGGQDDQDARNARHGRAGAPQDVGDAVREVLLAGARRGDPAMTSHLGRLAGEHGRVQVCGRCCRLEGEIRRARPDWGPAQVMSWRAPNGRRYFGSMCGPCSRIAREERRERRLQDLRARAGAPA